MKICFGKGSKSARITFTKPGEGLAFARALAASDGDLVAATAATKAAVDVTTAAEPASLRREPT